MPPPDDAPTGRLAPWMWAGGGAAMVVAGSVIGLYVERGPIAQRLAQDWLARHHVPADLAIRNLSLTSLTAGVRIGNPDHPALTVERMEVGYAVNWPWQTGGLGVRTRSVRLVRPRLALALTASGVELGPLQPLIDWVKSLPPGPTPDIDIEDGSASLAGAGGYLGLAGSASVRGGALSRAEARLAPFRLAVAGATVSGQGGELHATGKTGRLDLAPISLVTGQGQARARALIVDASLPAPGANGALAGHATLTARIDGLVTQIAGIAAEFGSANARLDGTVDTGGERTSFQGRARLSLADGRLSAGANGLKAVDGAVDLASVSLASGRAGVQASGAGVLDLDARLAGPQGTGAVSARKVKTSGFVVIPTTGRPVSKIALAGGLSGSGAVSAPTIRQATEGLAGAPDLRAAAARALAAFAFTAPAIRLDVDQAGPRLTLAAPARLTSASGAQLMLSPVSRSLVVGAAGAGGSARLALAGGGLPNLVAEASGLAISANRVGGHIQAEGAMDGAQIKGARFSLAGEVKGDGRHLTFALAGCAPLSAAQVGPAASGLGGLAASLCPDQAPALAMSPSGWSADLRFEAAKGQAADTAVEEASGTLAASGTASGLARGDLTLAHAAVTDRARPARFLPIALSGRATLKGQSVIGQFSAAVHGGRPLAVIHLNGDLVQNSGTAEIDTPELDFAPGTLQPTDLSPLAAGLTGARGAVRFHGRFAWRGGASTSSGALALTDFAVSTPLGPASGIATDLAFTSLVPLATAPGQVLRIDKIDAVTPVSGLEARFDLNSERLAIDAASATFAHGRVRLEPMSLPLAAGSATRGTLDLDHVDVGEIIRATSFAQQVTLDAVVDGALPFEASDKGLTIHGGHIEAVKPGRLSIARQALGAPAQASSKAAAAAGQSQLAQDLAYQALENLAFDQLDAKIDTRPGDRLGVVFHIRGRHAPPTEARATIAVSDLLRGKALAKPLTLPSGTQINLTLDTSLNFGELIRQMQTEWSAATRRAGSPAVQPGGDSIPSQ